MSLFRQPALRLANWPGLITDALKIGASKTESHALVHRDNPLKALSLFAELSDAEQNVILGHLHLESFPNKSEIFGRNQNSSALYIIRNGWVKVNRDSDHTASTALGAGALLGATDFFLNRPRNCTATAAGAVTLWSLSDRALTNVVTTFPAIGQKLGLAFGRGIAQFQNYLAGQMGRVPLLHGFSEVQRQVLARHISPQRYLPRETIFRSGQPPTGMFLIERGTVWLIDETGDGHTALLPGDTFGEKSVVYGRPHLFTAQTGEQDVVLWVLSPADFAAIGARHPSVAAAISHNVFTTLSNSLTVACGVIDSEIEALALAAGPHNRVVRHLRRVRHTLAWIRNNQLDVSAP